MQRDKSQIIITPVRQAVDVSRKVEVEASLGNGAIVSVELYEGERHFWVALGSDAFTGTFMGAVRLQEACGFYTTDIGCLERLGHALLAAAEKARDGKLPEQLAANLAMATDRTALPAARASRSAARAARAARMED